MIKKLHVLVWSGFFSAILLLLIQAHYNEYKKVFLPIGSVGAWDEVIREIGNMLKVYDTHYIYYSGHQGENARDNNKVYCGVAIQQKNGWHKYGKVGEFYCEDPYVIFQQGKFYMFYEEKEDVPDDSVSVATSDDGIHFSVEQKRVLRPAQTGWQNSDTSSPVIWAGMPYLMIYEGRGEGKRRFNQGATGIARSWDLLSNTWEKENAPIIIGSYEQLADPYAWDSYLAPDDLLKLGDTYYLTQHALNRRMGWTTGVWVSHNLKTWRKLVDRPVFSYDTVMMEKKGGCLQFFAYKPGKGIGYVTFKMLYDGPLPLCESKADRFLLIAADGIKNISKDIIHFFEKI